MNLRMIFFFQSWTEKNWKVFEYPTQCNFHHSHILASGHTVLLAITNSYQHNSGLKYGVVSNLLSSRYLHNTCSSAKYVIIKSSYSKALTWDFRSDPV